MLEPSLILFFFFWQEALSIIYHARLPSPPPMGFQSNCVVNKTCLGGIIADIIGFYSDLYMRRTFHLLQSHLDPTHIFILGDLLDSAKRQVLGIAGKEFAGQFCLSFNALLWCCHSLMPHSCQVLKTLSP